MVTPYVVQVVGFQNSGKTTLLLRLIEILTSQGYRTATIKHHGHGGQPQAVRGKDSSRHLAAGSIGTMVEGDGKLILEATRERWTLAEQITILSSLGPDVILVEGHKQEPYPKFVLIRDEGDDELLNLKNIQAVILPNQNVKVPETNVTTLFRGEEETLEFVVQHIKRHSGSL